MYTIGKLAQRAKINADSIRFYERQGLLSPANKTDTGYRLYTDEAVRRIAFIKHAQRCSFSLAEIRELLQMHNGDRAARTGGYRLAACKQAEIEDTMEALQAMSEALSGLLDADPAPEEMQFAESPLVLALEAGTSRERPESGARPSV